MGQECKHVVQLVLVMGQECKHVVHLVLVMGKHVVHLVLGRYLLLCSHKVIVLWRTCTASPKAANYNPEGCLRWSQDLTGGPPQPKEL
jgi:hypothetical protein